MLPTNHQQIIIISSDLVKEKISPCAYWVVRPLGSFSNPLFFCYCSFQLPVAHGPKCGKFGLTVLDISALAQRW